MLTRRTDINFTSDLVGFQMNFPVIKFFPIRQYQILKHGSRVGNYIANVVAESENKDNHLFTTIVSLRKKSTEIRAYNNSTSSALP